MDGSVDVHILPSEGKVSVPFNTTSSPTEHSSSSSALASLYVTFKVLQLVNVFRKRVKTRVHSTKECRATVEDDYCQAFERQAYEDIDRQLGRKRLYPDLRCRRKGFGDGERGFPVPHVTFADSDAATTTIADKRLDWLLREIDRSVTCNENSFDIVAKNDALFLEHCLEFQVKRLSLKQLTHLIVIVKDLLATLSRAIALTPKPKHLTNGTDFLHQASEDARLDETYLANLQHLLLRLQDQLLRQLVARCIELIQKHLVDCQKDQGKRCPAWFSEFPDAQHPLSTTWPWSIKPSLAVLWGVCWMFYDHNQPNQQSQSNQSFDRRGNWTDAQGNILVPSNVVRVYASAMQRQQQTPIQQQGPDEMYDTSLLGEVGLADPYAENGSMTNRVSAQPAPHQIVASRSSIASASPIARFHQHRQQEQQDHTTYQQRQQQQQQQQIHSAVDGESWPASGHEFLPVPATSDQQAGVSGDFQAGLAGMHNTTFAAAPSTYAVSGCPAAHQQHVPRDFLPEESFSTPVGFQTSDQLPYHSAGAVNGVAWSLPPHSSRSLPEEQPRSFYEQPLQPSPRRTRAQVTPPTIRVTTTFPTQAADFTSQPQETTKYSASSDSFSPHTNLAYNINYQPQVHLSPRRGPSPYMPPTEQDNMQTPPRSPLGSMGDINMADAQQALSRKRSHSTMSQTEHRPSSVHHHSRAHSITSTSAISPVDDHGHSPQISRAFKRGDPPTNPENKYVCDFADECRDMTFDRKCEWSKHMDKHDRPYRCPHPSCAKLQGFTYSGGLLRHEREVHGKHGGPKTQLMCPIEDCKRHVGKGFTRKENLNEHLRRVHSMKDHPSQGSVFRRDTQDTIMGAEDAETPASRISEVADFDEHSMMSPALGKRKRSILATSERATSEEVEDLKLELKRLRSEADRKDERIRQMEESSLAQDSKIQTLEEAVMRLQQVSTQGL